MVTNYNKKGIKSQRDEGFMFYTAHILIIFID